MRRKVIKVKRLFFTDQYGNVSIGSMEYDKHLTDANILQGYHELGKTAWFGGELWLLVNGAPAYRITVEVCYIYGGN